MHPIIAGTAIAAAFYAGTWAGCKLSVWLEARDGIRDIEDYLVTS